LADPTKTMTKTNHFENELLLKQVAKQSGIHEFFIKNGILSNEEIVRLLRAYAIIFERLEKLTKNEPAKIR
jgi:hypothetical protein